MTPRKVSRLRAIIECPGYNEDRCIQMGELSGFWLGQAIAFKWGPKTGVPRSEHSKVWHSYNIKSEMYRKRAEWYARRMANEH